MPSLKTVFITLLLSILIGACATQDDPSKWSAKRFYDEAEASLKSEDYPSAIKYFEDLEIHHPFSPYTQQAQLEVINAYYKSEDAESAIAAADRYIKLYPRDRNVDYAYYMRGLVSFDRGISGIDLFFDLDTTKRQPDTALQSYHYFEELIRRFPESKYAEDAKQRMVDLRNKLAKYELHVARYYLRRGAYLSAANRAKYAIETYPQTPAIPDALVLMIEAYRKLGVNDLADDAMKVLRLNYPEQAAKIESNRSPAS
jgi:outer membrane protein assembly factor BamD